MLTVRDPQTVRHQKKFGNHCSGIMRMQRKLMLSADVCTVKRFNLSREFVTIDALTRRSDFDTLTRRSFWFRKKRKQSETRWKDCATSRACKRTPNTACRSTTSRATLRFIRTTSRSETLKKTFLRTRSVCSLRSYPSAQDFLRPVSSVLSKPRNCVRRSGIILIGSEQNAKFFRRLDLKVLPLCTVSVLAAAIFALKCPLKCFFKLEL